MKCFLCTQLHSFFLLLLFFIFMFFFFSSSMSVFALLDGFDSEEWKSRQPLYSASAC